MVDVTNKPSATTQRQTGPQPQPGPYDNPGSDLYDWYTVNDALRNAGLKDWQIAGGSHQPVQQGKWVSNPGYNKLLSAQENKDLGNGDEFTYQPGDYVIGVVNPQTNQMLKLTLSRQGDTKTGYSWAVTGREDQGKLDKVQGGYTTPQTLTFSDGHQELWGTNSSTGAFEKMPGSPPNLGNTKGWNDVKQIDDGQGHQIWVGTDPATGTPLTPIPGAPQINTAKYTPGSVKQVTKNGKLVYVGQNPTTGGWEDIPELGSEAVKPTTVTRGQNVYQVDANGNLVPATGIPQPKEGDDQWVPAGAGRAKRQVYTNGDWHDDTDTPQKTVDPSLQRAEGALKPKGEKYWIPHPGQPDVLIQVTADGNGGYTYETGPNGEPPATMRLSGVTQPTTVTGAGTDEFLPSRRDAQGNLIPGERNPNWQPSNIGDRVRQLQELATQKQQQLHQQVVSGALTEDQANQQFNDWWDGSIEPAKQEIDQAARQKTLDTQRTADEQQRLNYSTALQAGQNAVEAAKAQMPYMVGPGFGAAVNNIQQAFSSGKAPGNFDIGSAITFQMPDLNALATQATNQALAHISPTAAQGMNTATGPNTPNYNPGMPQQAPNYDYTQALQKSRYQPGATTTIAPDGTVTVQHASPAAPAATPIPSAYTPPGGSSYAYPSVPWAGATPQPLSPALAPYQLT